MAKPPIKGVPPELNRRLDDLDRKTRRETIIKTIREIPVPGSVSTPAVSIPENAHLGEWVATDTSLKLIAYPAGEYMYEFAIKIVGQETSWQVQITKENEAIFTGLRPNTQYDCRVRALGIDGDVSPWSAVETIITDIDISAPPVPTGLSLAAEFTFIRAKVDEISTDDVPDFAGFEWHASIESGFTPSDSTFKDSSRTTRTIFHISDVGITWYVKVRSYDTNGNYSDYCTQVSVEVPPPKIPPKDSDPTDVGDIVIVEGTVEIEDCDTPTVDWESEASDAIKLHDAPGGFVKEGTGALMAIIYKYGLVAQQGIHGSRHTGIGSSASFTYRPQGFKVDSNCNLKRVQIWVAKIGAPPGLKVMIYTDSGGNPDAKLGEATFSGIDASYSLRSADFAPVIALTADTQYHMVFCRTDESHGAAFYSACYYSGNIYPYGTLKYSQDMVTFGDLYCDLSFQVFSDQESTNNHFKISSLAAKDLSDYKNIEFWVKGSSAGDIIQASMGEAALGEQTQTIAVTADWVAYAWDISGIANGDKDAIDNFGFKILAPNDDSITIFIDYIRATKEKKVKVKFSDEVVTIYPAEAGEGHIVLFPWFYDSIGQGTWGYVFAADYVYQAMFQNSTHADGDNFSLKAYLAAGTYTLKVTVERNTNRGILDVDVDGVEVASFDMYGALDTNHIFTETGIVIARSGVKTIKFRIDGKNALSSTYFLGMKAAVFYRTA